MLADNGRSQFCPALRLQFASEPLHARFPALLKIDVDCVAWNVFFACLHNWKPAQRGMHHDFPIARTMAIVITWRCGWKQGLGLRVPGHRTRLKTLPIEQGHIRS